jgi:hypothetical protein
MGDDGLNRDHTWSGVATEWVILTGDRRLIAAVLLAVALVVTTAIQFLLRPESGQPISLFYMASAIIGGNFTLLTIVISINQLVISRQLSAPGELQDEIANTTEYRDAAIELLETDTAPVTPASFLELLHQGVQDSIDYLRDRQPHLNEETAVELSALLTAIEAQVDQAADQLQNCNTGIFDALIVTLDTNYSEDIHHVWQLLTTYGSDFDDETVAECTLLVKRLKQIDIARQYLKTLYIQEELARLSRYLLYVGAPTILFGVGLLQVFVATEAAALSTEVLALLVPVFATVGVAPLAVLFAYVLRLSTVSERTVAITPFTTPTQEQQPEFKSVTADRPGKED